MTNLSHADWRRMSYLAGKRKLQGKTMVERAREIAHDELKYEPGPYELMEDPFKDFKPDVFSKKPLSVDQITKSWIRKNNQIESLSDSKITTGRRGVTKRRVVVEKESDNDNE